MSSWPPTPNSPDEPPPAQPGNAGAPPPEQPTEQFTQPAEQYPAQPGQPDPGQPYPGQAGQPYSAQPTEHYPPQPGQPYAQQGYPAQPNQQYPGQPYPGQQYPGQPTEQYPPQPGQPYGVPAPKSKGLSGGAIAGIAIGAVVLVGLIVWLVIALLPQSQASACRGGDMAACDALFVDPNVSPENEVVADTCGDLYPEGGYGGSCVSISELKAECEAGDMAACDGLYFLSGTDTALEEIAATCGGAFPEEFYGGNCEAVATLLPECEGGDMEACDDLYWAAQVGSRAEDVADTCGGEYPGGGYGGHCAEGDSPDTSSDSSLSMLVLGCVGGDMDQCDDLYWASDVGSDEETVAKTCGGLYSEADRAGNCATTSGTSTDTDASIDELYVACDGGDMQACDDLWWKSDIGSAEESFAATCGGRYAEERSAVCTTRTD